MRARRVVERVPEVTCEQRCPRGVVRSLAVLVVAALIAVTGLLMAPHQARAATVGLLQCEFGKFQAFDVQWFIEDDVLNISSIIPPFSSYPTPHPLTVEPPDPELTDSDYFKFVATDHVVPTPNPEGQTAIGFDLFASNGVRKLRMQEWGVFRAFGPGFIFYLGEGFWGTVVTTGQSFEYGSSAQLPVTRDSDDGVITAEEMLDYECQSSPLPPPGPEPVTVTAPTGSMTAGEPMPTLTPTVAPSGGLSTPATCAVFASNDTSFDSPVIITTSSPAGEYVIRCAGAVAAAGFGPITYVDGTLTVAADPTTTTTTPTPTSTTTIAESPGLPSTGRDSTLPLLIVAMTLICLGAGFVVFERSRRVGLVPATFSTTALETPSIPAPVVRVLTPATEAAPAPGPAPATVVVPTSDRASMVMERDAVRRRLAVIEGRTDAHSQAWAERLRARIDALEV